MRTRRAIRPSWLGAATQVGLVTPSRSGNNAREVEGRRFLLELFEQDTSALGELDDAELDVIVLKHWGNRTLPQIGTELELSKYQVAKTYREALERVRAELEGGH